MCNKKPVFKALNLSCYHGQGRKRFAALDSATFTVNEGEILSIVGESGSGKSTLAQVLLQLQPIHRGHLQFMGENLPAKKEYWKLVQMVFQNPYAAFNQFFTIKKQLNESFNLFPKRPSAQETSQLINEALRMVSLDPSEISSKYPFECSGGQMQRLLLARIFLIKPAVLIADEPTSMIDACSRHSILDCLLSLKRELNMTILFITHDIGFAAKISNRMVVLRRGKIVEQGTTEQILHNPQKCYTKQLMEHASGLRKTVERSIVKV